MFNVAEAQENFDEYKSEPEPLDVVVEEFDPVKIKEQDKK